VRLFALLIVALLAACATPPPPTPAAAVVVGKPGLRANGTVLHSSERGTYVVTCAHVAEWLTGEEVYVELANGERLPARPVLPTPAELSAGRTLQTPARDDSLAEQARAARGQALVAQRKVEGDLALLRVERPGRLPAARLSDQGSAWWVQPRTPPEGPRAIELYEAPHRTQVPRSERLLWAGNSGSGVFDVQGRLHAVVSHSPTEGRRRSSAGGLRTYVAQRGPALRALGLAEVAEELERVCAALAAQREEAANKDVWIGLTPAWRIRAWLEAAGWGWLLSRSP